MSKRTSVILFFLSWGLVQAAPSFDCSKASTAVEQAICSSAELSRLDRQLAQAYRGLAATERDAQRAWIRQRNACKSDIDCLTKQYQDRIVTLERLAGVHSPSQLQKPQEIQNQPDAAQSAPEPVAADSVLTTASPDLAPQSTPSRASVTPRKTESYLTDAYNEQLYNRLGLDGWAFCASNQIALSALDARDGLPKNISEANRELGKVLGSLRGYLLATGYPEARVGGALRNATSFLGSADQALENASTCLNTIASEMSKVSPRN